MASPQVVSLPDELVELVESGVTILVGTRDARLRPECVRAVGASVRGDRRAIRVVLNEATSARTAANAAAGSPVAVTFSRAADHRTVQLKGRCLRVGAGTPEDHELARRYLSAFTEALYVVGVSRALARRLRVEPCLAIEVEVGELFQQTPGPEAGQRLGTS